MAEPYWFEDESDDVILRVIQRRYAWIAEYEWRLTQARLEVLEANRILRERHEAKTYE